MSRDAHLVPEFDGRGADKDPLSCRPRGVERAFEHIRKADARNGLRLDAEIDEIALRSRFCRSLSSHPATVGIAAPATF